MAPGAALLRVELSRGGWGGWEKLGRPLVAFQAIVLSELIQVTLHYKLVWTSGAGISNRSREAAWVRLSGHRWTWEGWEMDLGERDGPRHPPF